MSTCPNHKIEESPEFQDLLKSSTERRHFKKSEILYRAGDEPQLLFFLERGLVGLSLMSEAGREHLVRLFVPSDFMSHRSLFAEEPYHATATALEDCQVSVMPKSKFFEFMNGNSLFCRFFLRRLAFDLGECEKRHKRLVENDAASRVAGALVYLKEMDSSHVWTRKEIADFSGTTTETVIRTLGRFEEEGLIAQKGRPIEIKNRPELIQIARFDE